MPFQPKTSSTLRGIINGYRSGLESKIAKQLEEDGIPVLFETMKIPYLVPERTARYTPDFVLPGGIVVESKGLFETKDRQKHLFIKAQFPHLDIRFVFSNSKSRLSKASPTTYAAWCDKYGFIYADKTIPRDWYHATPQGHH